MDSRSYWLDLFTGSTWKEFLQAGGNISGFCESRWKLIQQIRKRDYLLCYLTGISRFIGVLEVMEEPLRDDSPIWTDEIFPCRLKVKPIIELNFQNAVPVIEFKDRLSCFQGLKNPNAWTGYFRGSPVRWMESDGKVVLAGLIEARDNPIARPYDERKLKYRPKAIKANKNGSVTIPEPKELEPDLSSSEKASHLEIQCLLLKLGSDMGFNINFTKLRGGRLKMKPTDKQNLVILMGDDDHEDDRQLLRDAYGQADLKGELYFVTNGLALIQYLREGEYGNLPRQHIVLLDLSMPIKDWKETVIEIKSDDKLKHIPVVMFTTSSQKEDEYFCYTCGAVSFATMPFTFDELIEFIKCFPKYWSELVNLPAYDFCYMA